MPGQRSDCFPRAILMKFMATIVPGPDANGVLQRMQIRPVRTARASQSRKRIPSFPFDGAQRECIETGPPPQHF